MDQDHVEWVRERSKCNLEDLYKEMCNLLAKDTQIREEIVKRREERKTFQFDRLTEGMVRVTCSTGQKLTFLLLGNNIEVRNLKEEANYSITTKWDNDAVQCKIVYQDLRQNKSIEYPHHDLQKVVAMILGPFFFDH